MKIGGGENLANGEKENGSAQGADRNPKMKRKLYNYYYSFEVNSERLRANREAINIHEIIRLTRKEYPDAKMFTVIDKRLAPAG